ICVLGGAADLRAAAAFCGRAALDSLHAATQGPGRTQSIFGMEGEVLVHGRAPLGEQAWRLSDQGAAEDLRLIAGADRRSLRDARRFFPAVHRGSLRALLPARARN